ncbi:iron-siderophore ABC transporter substrate-binding protein [Streptomyces sp. V2]|uniref:ABC transporter substrate-binding protein n=2 Tax=Streptomyces niveiscabiei TaxID=164115 RepID=A0ABW9I0H8_9ACTN|nr:MULTISPECIES: iron-siderophore ABC transporter substrate-binding protein [unclassified Streptomyces]PWG12746.1 iron-siderophore ABC transporter substrate-binding protein [Streptomyces sp. V2]QZZ31455.1 iron-siderophore ABC transporter substrate-binding protein [Streptomyces sp. ST1015]
MGTARTTRPASGAARTGSVRHRGGALLAVAALSVTLAACGSSDDGDGGDDRSTPSTQAGGAFPVQVKHSEGSLSLKAAPTRVVALSAMDLDAALAVGVTPVGAAKDPFGEKGISPWLTGKLGADTTLVNTSPDVSFEQIAALKPDLILATGDYGISKNYARLNQIAPTLGPASSAADDSWQGRQTQIGKALGKEAAATKAVADTEALIRKTADTYPALKGKTFSASFAYSATQIATIASPDDFAVKFLESLGLQVTPALKGTEGTATKTQPGLLSPEQAGRLASDFTVIGFTSPQVRSSVEKNPAYTKVKSTGVYTPVDTATITELRNPSILGIPWLLEELTPSFKAVK